MATSTAPRDWWEEPPEVLLTAVEVLEEQAERMRRGR